MLPGFEDEDGRGVQLGEAGIEAAAHEEVAGEGLSVAPPAGTVYVLLYHLIGTGEVQTLQAENLAAYVTGFLLKTIGKDHGAGAVRRHVHESVITAVAGGGQPIQVSAEYQVPVGLV